MECRDRQFPFPHLLIAPVLPDEIEDKCISMLESLEWERRSSEFYRFSVPRDRSEYDRLLQLLSGSGFLAEARITFERGFGSNLDDRIYLEVHRYEQGCGIGPHTDALTLEIRCIVNLNRSWRVESGGIWIIAADSALQLQRSYLPSTSNTGFAFPTSSTSYHALTTCRAGLSYGLTVRFCFKSR
jgi:hypothetical protein